jgi:hypothetical protein
MYTVYSKQDIIALSAERGRPFCGAAIKGRELLAISLMVISHIYFERGERLLFMYSSA